MQKRSGMFDDMAKMMSGATNMAFDMKREMEAMIARQMEVMLGKTSLVSREEFEAVKRMAEKARDENDVLRARLDALSPQDASNSKGAASKASKPTTGKRTGTAKDDA